MTYSDTRRFVGDSCPLESLAWSAVVALPKGISESQRQEALKWLATFGTDLRPRVKPRKRKSD